MVLSCREQAGGGHVEARGRQRATHVFADQVDNTLQHIVIINININSNINTPLPPAEYHPDLVG